MKRLLDVLILIPLCKSLWWAADYMRRRAILKAIKRVCPMTLGLFACALVAAAQTPAPDALPSHWLGLSVSYNPAQHPRTTGGFTFADLMGKNMYSFSTEDVTLIKGRFVSSPRTGVAMVQPLYEDKLYLVAFGNVGVATTGSSASFAAAGGGLLFYRLGKSGHYTVHGGFHVLNTGALGGLVNVPEAGLGFAF